MIMQVVARGSRICLDEESRPLQNVLVVSPKILLLNALPQESQGILTLSLSSYPI